jgi:hypothetical protein
MQGINAGDEALKPLVGWVERSDTQQVAATSTMMGIATLNPSYRSDELAFGLLIAE